MSIWSRIVGLLSEADDRPKDAPAQRAPDPKADRRRALEREREQLRKRFSSVDAKDPRYAEKKRAAVARDREIGLELATIGQGNAPVSGLRQAQQDVDRLSRQYPDQPGIAADYAKMKGVPSTAARTVARTEPAPEHGALKGYLEQIERMIDAVGGEIAQIRRKGGSGIDPDAQAELAKRGLEAYKEYERLTAQRDDIMRRMGELDPDVKGHRTKVLSPDQIFGQTRRQWDVDQGGDVPKRPGERVVSDVPGDPGTYVKPPAQASDEPKGQEFKPKNPGSFHGDVYSAPSMGGEKSVRFPNQAVAQWQGMKVQTKPQQQAKWQWDKFAQEWVRPSELSARNVEYAKQGKIPPIKHSKTLPARAGSSADVAGAIGGGARVAGPQPSGDVNKANRLAAIRARNRPKSGEPDEGDA